MSPSDPLDDALTRIANRAAAADRGEVTLAADLALLHETGLLAALVEHTCPGCDALEGARLLRRIGRVSLPVGRIVEGHANALRLITLYGTSAQNARVASAAARGAVFGVWGAEGPEPVEITARRGDDVTMSGSKHFCSGLGLLSHAVLPVDTAEGPQLLLADVRDAWRGDGSGWQVGGMRATASGRYTLDGAVAQIVGGPGDYLREPHFEGGVWRYCALQCGGLEALADGARRHILARGKRDDPHQRARFADLVIHARTARLWVEASALVVEGGRDPASAVEQALLAREAVERACLAGIALTERILGTAAFASRGDADRIRRDLAFFLRQADLDGKLARAGAGLLSRKESIGDMRP